MKSWNVWAWALVLLVGPVAMAQAPDAGVHAQHRMGVHGMVLFGAGKSLYASHIPMFQRPHDRQILLRVSLSGEGLKAGRDFSDGLYTLAPERFDLDLLEQGKLKQFKATVHQGNFEASGPVLHKDVTVRVEAVEHVQALDAAAQELPALSYWLVGEGKQAYLVHTLSRAPDFDQVVKVTLDKPLPRQGKGLVRLGFAPRKNTAELRLKAGEQLVATREAGPPVRLTIQRELSFLVGPDFTP
jgi:hypothetical protein